MTELNKMDEDFPDDYDKGYSDGMEDGSKEAFDKIEKWLLDYLKSNYFIPGDGPGIRLVLGKIQKLRVCTGSAK